MSSRDVDVTIEWHSAEDIVLLSRRDVVSLVDYALRAESTTGEWEFAIRVVDDDTIAGFHARYMEDPSPTDIMTFPYDPEDGVAGADILISLDTARMNADSHGWSVDQELRFLVLHGVLHTLGWNDHDAPARELMLQRQSELLKEWERHRGTRAEKLPD